MGQKFWNAAEIQKLNALAYNYQAPYAILIENDS